jgi:2-dehydropantoate 2-reductase
MGAPVGGGCIIYFGEHDGRESDSARAVEKVLKDAGIDGRFSQSVHSEIWEKYLFNSGIGPFLRLAGAPCGVVFAREDMLALAEEMAREMVNVARAHGVGAGDDVVDRTMERLQGMGREMPAFESRAVAGRPGESVSTASTCRLGREAGVPTPICDVITAVVGLEQDVLAAEAAKA